MRHQLKCPDLNRVEDCDAILTRAPWLPGYEESLSIVPGLASAKPYFAPETQYLKSTEKRTDYKRVLYSAKKPKRVVALPRIVGQVDFPNADNRGGFFHGVWHSDQVEKRVAELPQGWPRVTADQLYSLGKPFLYGMLHRYLFDFSDAVKESVPELYQDDDSNHEMESFLSTYTVALHSRHPNGLNGCDIQPEQKCVRQLLKKKPADQLCRVWVLADRKCTISTLKNWLELVPKCSVEVATHSAGKGTRDEHGPFAGVGFFRILCWPRRR